MLSTCQEQLFISAGVYKYCGGFDLTTRDSYFTILVDDLTFCILVENTHLKKTLEFTEHKLLAWKPANKCQIIWQYQNFKNILVNEFQHHSYFIKQKIGKHHFLESRKLQFEKTRKLTIQIFTF